MRELKKREKILAAAAGTVGVLMAGWLLWAGDGGSAGALRAERKRLAAEADKRHSRIEAADAAKTRLAQWSRRSLPADPANARSLYQSWLRELAHEAGMRQLDVQPGEGQSRKGVFTTFSFTVRGRAKLAQLTRFLYDFYSAGHLDQLRRLDVKPIESAADLDVTMTIEALSLPGADREGLSKEKGARLRLAGLDDYAGVIVGRNLFAPYAPAKTSSHVDPRRYTIVTAITEVESPTKLDRHVWLEEWLTGKKWRLAEGDVFEVAGTRGTIKKIGQRDVLIELDGRTQRFRYGDNLLGGTDVPQEPRQE
ncbi:MAG: hypothetical protein ABR915_22960 [Thermoguttaceae bacterium]|jgi:hypothetical protein